jgi:hypothetical protein
MVAFALRADGWYLRSDIIWAKPNPMPESVTDRPTKAHEYLFLLSKSPRYYFDADAIREDSDPDQEEHNQRYAKVYDGPATAPENGQPGNVNNGGIHSRPGPGGRNKRSVWTVSTTPFPGAHFATFPPALIEPCILAGCPPAGKRCDCDEIIGTPLGVVENVDPSLEVGRAGMSRPRGSNEGTRPITRREQRGHAAQLRNSPHRDEMREICGPAFDHYIRTDHSGARPLPPAILEDFTDRGWVTSVPPCDCPVEPAGTVLDPFSGAGTTGIVALRHDRSYVGVELNPEYVEMSRHRICDDAPLLNTPLEVAA